MKRIFVLLIALTVASTVVAQDLDKIAQLACDCVAGKDLSKLPSSEIEMTLGLCLLEASSATGYEFDPTDVSASTNLGKKVGVQMAVKCPTVFTDLTGYLAEKKAQAKREELVETSGKVKSVSIDEVVTVTVKEGSGKEVKFLWLRYFPGSDEFVSAPKKLVGKEITISYREIECYMPKAGGYFKQKEIASIEIK